MVTDIGRTNKLVGEENGLVVPWADSEAVAYALASLFESTIRIRRMGQNSLRIAMQFDWEEFTERHVALFSHVQEDRQEYTFDAN